MVFFIDFGQKGINKINPVSPTNLAKSHIICKTFFVSKKTETSKNKLKFHSKYSQALTKLQA